MRILYVTSYYKPAYVYGGPTRIISALCEALVSQGAQVTVLTTNANGTQRLDVPLKQPVDMDGVEVWYYPIVPVLPRSFLYSPALAQACARNAEHFDLAVLETLYTHAVGPAVAACRGVQIPYVVSPHGQLMPWALRHRHLKKKIYMTLAGRNYLNGAAALHCESTMEAEAIAKLHLKVPSFVVPNGLDIDRWSRLPIRGPLRQRLGIPMDAKVLLFLGRLHRVKRPDIALTAWHASDRSDVHLIYAGPDEERLKDKLLYQAQQLGDASRVHFTGLLNGSEVLQALVDADLLLMPSMTESFGRSALEAMAAALPILASTAVPTGRWAEQAGAGRLAPSTPEAFSKATQELLSMPEQLEAMGRRGQAFAREQFDIQVVARQTLAQYKEILISGRPLLTE